VDISIKRVYDPPSDTDGTRVLVDRLWPRGLSKERAHIDLWLREIAPSDELRRWFSHRPERWEIFRKRYIAELAENRSAVQKLLDLCRKGKVTLLYSTRNGEQSNAAALLYFLLH